MKTTKTVQSFQWEDTLFGPELNILSYLCISGWICSGGHFKGIVRTSVQMDCHAHQQIIGPHQEARRQLHWYSWYCWFWNLQGEIFVVQTQLSSTTCHIYWLIGWLIGCMIDGMIDWLNWIFKISWFFVRVWLDFKRKLFCFIKLCILR